MEQRISCDSFLRVLVFFIRDQRERRREKLPSTQSDVDGDGGNITIQNYYIVVNYPIAFYNSIRCWVRTGKKSANLNELSSALVRYLIKNGRKDYIWIHYKDNPDVVLEGKIFN